MSVLCSVESHAHADHADLSLPEGVKLEFPNKDDLMNFNMTLIPSEVSLVRPLSSCTCAIVLNATGLVHGCKGALHIQGWH